MIEFAAPPSSQPPAVRRSSITPKDLRELLQTLDALGALGLTSAALQKEVPGAFIRRAHMELDRYVIGVDPGPHDLSVVESVAKALAKKLGVPLKRVFLAPIRECCRSGCGGCINGPGVPKEVALMWLRRRPATKTTQATG